MSRERKLQALADLQEINRIVDQLSHDSQVSIHAATKGIAEVLELVKPELRGVVVGIIGLCAEIGEQDE